jgi:hypothetical protein
MRQRGTWTWSSRNLKINSLIMIVSITMNDFPTNDMIALCELYHDVLNVFFTEFCPFYWSYHCRYWVTKKFISGLPRITMSKFFSQPLLALHYYAGGDSRLLMFFFFCSS